MAVPDLITPRGFEWTRLPLAETQEVVRIFNARIAPIPFSPNTTTVHSCPLAFYDEGHLYALTELSTLSPMTRYGMSGGDRAVVLDWSNGPLYQLNEAAPVRLNRGRVGDYVRLFFSFVRGRHGLSRLIEDIDDLDLPGPSPDVDLDATIHPLLLEPSEDEGPYNLRGLFEFEGALFRSDITVAPDGMVEMENEEHLIDGSGADPVRGS